MRLKKWWFKSYKQEQMNKTVNGKTVLSLFIITNVVYVYMLLVSIPKVISFAGGMKIPDMMPTGYEPEYILTLLEKLGDQGRHVYLYQQIPIDLCYPFLFGITYCMVIIYLLQKIQKLNGETISLCLLPLMGGIFDYMENFSIIHMLTTFPGISVTSIKISAFFTVFKSMLSSISFMVIIILLLMFVLRKLVKAK
jgi:hypothetical protein